ncbi:hypothetical protein L596_021152 [Steinernema carpocapsae]|uniref:Uncharacterized protein n=1 Tax=Steinernema carpocapsae TaxID=34508 RepID=A0A4V6A142_STECR|nr:hypothetical protein L596_021152 [Steinernema carpocapsae]
MHIHFNPSSDVDWERFFKQQAEQHGAGISNPFRGYAYQRGTGIGDIFRGVFRYIMPIIKRASVKNELFNTGSRILNDLAHGEKVSHSIKKQGLEGAKNMVKNYNHSGGARKRRSVSKKKKPVSKTRKVTFL